MRWWTRVSGSREPGAPGAAGATGAPAPAPGAPEAGAPDTPAQDQPFLHVDDLHVAFDTDDGLVRAVDGVTLRLERGRTLGVVGESGSGKTVMSLAILGLVAGRRTRMSGSIRLDGEDLVTARSERLRRLRGGRMAMIFQDPLSSLHPYFTVGSQLAEAYRAHQDAGRRQAWTRGVEMLDRVGIPQPRERARGYPHQLSGGMRQRVMIAMALINNPELLIADEPTTALDVTVQAEILDLMRDLQREFGSAILLITHDLGVVAEVADDVLVMYAGQVMEYGSARQVFGQPRHPYTWGLLTSITRLDRARQARLPSIPGTPPSLISVPSGCPFHPRCPYEPRSRPASSQSRPALIPVTGAGAIEDGSEHFVACHLDADEQRRLFRAEVAPLL